MADINKIKLPDSSEYNIIDYRIPGVDTVPISGSDNVVTSGGVYTAIENNELVIATALNDLNDRLSDVENITIPTKVSDLENDSGFTSNTGTLTGVSFNGTAATVSNGVASISASIPAEVTESTVSGWGFIKNAAPGTLNTNNSTAQTTSASESFENTINLHKISKTGTYSDLIGTPVISSNIATDKADNTKIAGTKATYDEIHPAVVTSQPAGGFLPNVLYNLGTITGTVAFTMASPNDSTITNHYYWTFETSSTAPTITWPVRITSWYGGGAPSIVASKHYEISVLDGVGCYIEV